MPAIHMHEVLRYPREDRDRPMFGAFQNIFAVTGDLGRRITLDSGINRVSLLPGSGERRTRALLVRSSPWKAGSESTPWHDIFDLDFGHVRYFGDHKPSKSVPVGETSGNKAMLQQFALHCAGTREERLRAAPLLLFRSVRVEGRDKGHVEFCGVGLIERVELVTQWDATSRTSFPNYVYDILVLDLAADNEAVDWKWVDARRDPATSLEQALHYAPLNWKKWVARGSEAAPSARRRLSRSRVLAREEQLPPPGSAESLILQKTYKAFESSKVAFEKLAADITAGILGRSGARYHAGWLTRPSADRGIDFVGRLELGDGNAKTSIVVLGQAKCIKPSGPGISAEQLARLVARLRRGWIGVYVTTGTFTEAAQQEMVEDEYPVVLIDGRRLSEEVRRLAYVEYAGEVERLFERIRGEHALAVLHRRPEEILLS